MSQEHGITILDTVEDFFGIKSRLCDDYFVMVLDLKKTGLICKSTEITITYDFINFFEEMASEWNGWEQDKVYDDGDIRFIAKYMKTGHISFNVYINSESWSVETSFDLEAGQLELLAKGIRSLAKVA